MDRTSTTWCAALLLVSLAGCSNDANRSPSSAGLDASSAETSTPHACDPLATGEAKPTSLKGVLGAGRHPDGTVYVLDQGTLEYRAFVSSGQTLHRKVVSGSGTSETEIVATVDDATAPFALKIEREGGVAKRMGVLRGALVDKTFTIGSGGSAELTLLGESELASFNVLDVPASVVVEYDAFTPAQDGRRIIVTRPKVDVRYEDFRVFFGKPSETMLERKIANLGVTKSSTTTIQFDVEGVTYVAVFPSSTLSPNAGPPTLGAESGPKMTLTLADDAQVSARGSLSYVCIR